VQRRSAGLGAAFAATALSGCLKLNPAYDSGGESEGGSGEPVTTGGMTTGEATTGAIDETTDGGSSSSGGETTGSNVPTLSIGAEVATCVLTAIQSFSHVGPAACEQRTSEGLGLAGGGMIVDEEFNENGDGRPGIVFMRFAIPAQVGELDEVLSATLVFHVADPDGAASGAGGAVRLAMPFTAGDLETKAPGWIPGFEELVGAISPGQQVQIVLPPAAITAGTPLHVGIWPYSNDAAVYLSNAAAGELRPRLDLTLAP
jgi:hypothetical protein